MSHLLESAARLDPQRAADLMDDEALEKERQKADLDYLARREERFKQQLAALHEAELIHFRSLGWL